jgi:hypothetical protein
VRVHYFVCFVSPSFFSHTFFFPSFIRLPPTEVYVEGGESTCAFGPTAAAKSAETVEVAAAAPPPFALYTALRRANPAPYAAFFAFDRRDEECNGGRRDSDAGPLSASSFAICCSSPERFLRSRPRAGARGRGGVLESKPIKGTVPRHVDPAKDAANAEALRTSAKDRAENLMIVDLVRRRVRCSLRAALRAALTPPSPPLSAGPK